MLERRGIRGKYKARGKAVKEIVMIGSVMIRSVLVRRSIG